MRIEVSDYALKLSGWPVTALAVNSCGRGTGPGNARAAPGHPAAYRKRQAEAGEHDEPSHTPHYCLVRLSSRRRRIVPRVDDADLQHF